MVAVKKYVNGICKILWVIFLTSSSVVYSQVTIPEVENFKPNPERERMFLPYLAIWHGGIDKIEEWKKNNTVQYYKELWYYTESFYIKRNHFEEGVTMDEEIIDISRFEQERKPDAESIVVLQGYKDVLVLLPANKLKYKPESR